MVTGSRPKGLDRGLYGVCTLVIFVVTLTIGAGLDSRLAAGLFACVALLYVTGHRLESIGYPSGAAFFLFMPVANLVVWFICVTLPPGYARTKQLDGTAYLMIALGTALIIAFLANL